MWKRIAVWLPAIVVGLILLMAIAAAFVDEPLRRYVEGHLNRRVQGYTFHVGKLDLHPLTLGVDLEDLALVQKEHPDPPIARIPKWTAGIHWADLFSGHIVSDHRIERPVIRWTRPQAKEAKRDLEYEKATAKRRWQEVVESIYPITINQLTIRDAEITYLDHPAAEPVRLSRFNLDLAHVHNVKAQEGEYPSDLHLDANALDEGHLRIDGKADVLAIPYPSVKADIALHAVPLGWLIGVLGRYHVQLRHGIASADGFVDHSPSATRIEVRSLRLKDVKLDYVYAGSPDADRGQVKQVVETAQAAANRPGLVVKIQQGMVENSEFGFVNHVSRPEYRVFLTGTDVYLENVSNHLSEGTAIVRLRGMFMGSGATTVRGTFRPETTSPDFDLDVQIMKTRLKSMNNLFRAYGDFDVNEGVFSLFSELSVKNGTVDGYLKPLFKDVDVYNREQDREKGLVKQAYEGAVGGLAALLSNRPRHAVATKTEVAGPVRDPHADTWEVLVNVIRNAFFQTILPGFERQERGVH